MSAVMETTTVATPEGDKRVEVLSTVTSFTTSHNHSSAKPPPGVRCSACRWSDITLYRVVDEKAWVIESVGSSVVPGEDTWRQCHYVTSPFVVITTLERTNAEGVVYLTRMAATLLAEASEKDLDIRAAFYE